jgi:hypothetical protein
MGPEAPAALGPLIPSIHMLAYAHAHAQSICTPSPEAPPRQDGVPQARSAQAIRYRCIYMMLHDYLPVRLSSALGLLLAGFLGAPRPRALALGGYDSVIILSRFTWLLLTAARRGADVFG